MQEFKGMQNSMAVQKIEAYVALAQKNEGLWSALVVFIATLMLLSSIPFYPIYVSFALALVCAAIAFRNPALGLIAGCLTGFLAVIYQSAVFGWFYLLVLAAVMLTVFDDWLLVAALIIFILAPFAFGRLPLAGWISMLGMGIGALHFGSRRSLSISLVSVAMILLLSSVWLVENSAYMPLRMNLYMPGKAELQLNKPPADIAALGSEAAAALGRFLDLDNITKVWDSTSWMAGNAITLALSDSLVLQVLSWGVALYIMSYLSARIKKRPQLTSSLALLLLIPAYYAIGTMYGTGFKLEFAGGIIFTIAALGALENYGISISREAELGRKEKMKAYGKFGMSDMAAGGTEQSMDDVGGYEDVKQELRDAIMMPLQKKEIAHAYGISAPKGILLFGPPGTGKTMLMRALAKELGFNFIEVRCSQILSQWYGESLPHDEKLLIRNENGGVRLREIGKIVENKQKIQVLSFDLQGKAVFANVTGWIKHKRASPMYEVRTRTGRRIRVTGCHSLFTLDGTRIESIATAKLKPKDSYIAIPSRIGFPTQTIDKIDFIGSLTEDDHGLLVKNAGRYLVKAVENLGRKKVGEILGYRGERYVDQVIKLGVGVRIIPFLRLMGEAAIAYNRKDLLVGAGSKRLPGEMKIDEDLATFIGLWVAEGSYNRKDTVRISTSEQELEKISGLCRRLFGKITVYSKKGGKGRDIYIGSRPLYVFLRHTLGLKDGSSGKMMPEIAFNLGKDNMAALLRGYFSGDGSVYENQKGVAMVEAITTSKALADQLLYLLLHFGIVATMCQRKEWSGSQSYRIYMTGGRVLGRFNGIGFLQEKKMARIHASLARVGWFREEQVPIQGTVRDFIETNLPKWRFSSTIGRGILTDQMESDDVGILESGNDIYLDRVEEIKSVDGEEFVYDVSVDPCQNFVAGFGGIFAHNSEKNLGEVFHNARKSAPTVLFFDELDSVAKKRSTMTESLDTVGPRVLTTLLQEMDGAVKSDKTVIVIGATNLPDELDPAILRPGRFDKIIYMHLPDPEARKAIFKVSMKRMRLAPDVDLDKLVKKTDRFSGADIKNIVEEAKKITAREAIAQDKVIPTTMAHLMKVMEGMKPSTGLAQLETYEQFRMDFERRTGAVKPKEEEVEKEAAIGWDDVVGLDQVKEAFLEAIEFPLLREAEMKEFKVKPSKGILLFGPPGTGKTLIVKAAAHELKASFQTISGAELMKKGYTQAVTVIKETFNRARENAPGIIFVDEIETFAPARGMAASSEILGQFLTEMDGIRNQQGVVVIGATNKPFLMDPAIMRPGRFDKIFYIPPPDAHGRKDMFALYLGNFAEGVDLNLLSGATGGFSGADIASVCQSAKMEALRGKIAGKPVKITTESVLQVVKTRRPSITPELLDEYEKFIEAYGERR